MLKYPAAAACLFLILGILAGTLFHPPDFIAFCALAVGFVAGLIALHKKSIRWLIVFGAVSLVLLGVFRYNLSAVNFPPNHISGFNNLPQQVMVIGRIVREPDVRPDKTYLTVECDTLYITDEPIPTSGLMLARIAHFDDRFNYADRIAVTGYLGAPFERRNFHGFDYRRYLMLKRINSYVSVKHREQARVLGPGEGNRFLSGIIIPLREYILDVFKTRLAGSEQHLVAGFLIGETRFIPQQLYERFRDTGTLHLLAVSGSNVALVIGTLVFLFRFAGVRRRVVDVLSLGVIIVFCQLSFNQPSVVRASLMIGLVLIGRIVYRKGSLLNIIAVAALLILMINPMMLFDVGFQLSFAAAFSLIYLLKGMMPRSTGLQGMWKKVLLYGLMILASSVVVQIMVAPILAYYFGRIPLITFISNLLVIPLASLSVTLSLLLVLFAPVPILGDLLAVLTQLSLHISIWLVDFFASLPVVKLSVGAPSLTDIVFYYATLFLFYGAFRSTKSLRYLLLIVFVWANILVWKSVARQASPNATVTFLDLGSETAMHVRIPPDYDFMLTNAQSDGGFDQVERIIIPYLSGEGADETELWGTCSSGEETATDQSALMLESLPALQDSNSDKPLSNNDYAIHLWKSTLGVEKAHVILKDHSLLWLSSWDWLGSSESDSISTVDILALPYPSHPVSKYFDRIRLLSPSVVIIYSYPSWTSHVDLDFLAQQMHSFGVQLIDTQKRGAVRFSIGQTDVSVTCALSAE